jgi:hypothetical protein
MKAVLYVSLKTGYGKSARFFSNWNWVIVEIR